MVNSGFHAFEIKLHLPSPSFFVFNFIFNMCLSLSAPVSSAALSLSLSLAVCLRGYPKAGSREQHALWPAEAAQGF